MKKSNKKGEEKKPEGKQRREDVKEPEPEQLDVSLDD